MTMMMIMMVTMIMTIIMTMIMIMTSGTGPPKPSRGTLTGCSLKIRSGPYKK